MNMFSFTKIGLYAKQAKGKMKENEFQRGQLQKNSS